MLIWLSKEDPEECFTGEVLRKNDAFAAQEVEIMAMPLQRGTFFTVFLWTLSDAKVCTKYAEQFYTYCVYSSSQNLSPYVWRSYSVMIKKISWCEDNQRKSVSYLSVVVIYKHIWSVVFSFGFFHVSSDMLHQLITFERCWVLFCFLASNYIHSHANRTDHQCKKSSHSSDKKKRRICVKLKRIVIKNNYRCKNLVEEEVTMLHRSNWRN